MTALPVLLTAALASGVALALVSGVAAAWAAALLVLASAAAAWAAIGGRSGALVVSSVVALIAAGAALGADADARARSPRLDRLARQEAPVLIEGRLIEDASPSPSGVRLRVAVRAIDGLEAGGGEAAALTVGGTMAGLSMAGWRAGRVVRVPATVRRPAHYRNPGVRDDRLALARRGLTLVGSVKSGALVEVVQSGSWRQERAADLRAHVRRAMGTHVAPRDPIAAAVATAILIGDRAGLDADVERRLQAAGTYHVIAISGGNIAVLTMALLGIARLARLPPLVAGPLVAALLIAHADLVGPGASVTRATSMAVIYLGLRAIDQSAWNVNALAAACGGLLVWSPLALVDPGFLLSAGATAAILLLATRPSDLLPATGWRRAAIAVVAASAATELVLMPIAATLFNRVTFAGLLLNLAAVPLMTVVQAAASATVLAEALLPMLAAPCGVVTAWAATALVASAGLVEVAPWLSVRTPSPPWTVSGLYFAAVAALAALPALAGEGPRRRLARRLCFTTVACLGLVILAAPSTWPWWWRADGVLRVIALDVGQGDATLIEFPDGTRWLVDAGGLPWASRYDIGARVVAPALWTRGVGRLATLLLTHGDPDHIGGATAVVDDFRPAVVEGIPVPAHPPMQQLAAHARQRRRPWATVTRGRRMEVAGVEVLIRHPLPPDWERRKVRNDDSVVVELRYGDISVVLPGDIGAAIEQEIGSLFPPARIRLLKAAHHGSATSTSDAWLDGLRPDAVVISCGRDNRYGHPAAAVLERLAARRLPVFRTDRDGQVVVEADGRSVLARTFSGRVATITKTTNGTHEEHDTPTRSRNLVARMRQLKR